MIQKVIAYQIILNCASQKRETEYIFALGSSIHVTTLLIPQPVKGIRAIGMALNTWLFMAKVKQGGTSRNLAACSEGFKYHEK